MTAIDRATQHAVLRWFDKHGRSFAWRGTRDPYRTLVAEVMLQQTQTGRVGPIYAEFLTRFPTFETLASAPAAEVIRSWRGLGYNRRAVGLHRAAQVVVREFGGRLPSDPRLLRMLPGVGEYTANAVACFAYDAQVPVVDVNVRRVLGRVLFGRDPERIPRDKLSKAVAASLPLGKAYAWNQALMDVGATMCRAGQPLCRACPLRAICTWRSKGRAAPRRPAKSRERFEGSRRQVRGRVVDHLRRAAKAGITVGSLLEKLNLEKNDESIGILTRLEDEGLVRLSAAARRGSLRGVVRLPE